MVGAYFQQYPGGEFRGAVRQRDRRSVITGREQELDAEDDVWDSYEAAHIFSPAYEEIRLRSLNYHSTSNRNRRNYKLYAKWAVVESRHSQAF